MKKGGHIKKLQKGGMNVSRGAKCRSNIDCNLSEVCYRGFCRSDRFPNVVEAQTSSVPSIPPRPQLSSVPDDIVDFSITCEGLCCDSVDRAEEDCPKYECPVGNNGCPGPTAYIPGYCWCDQWCSDWNDCCPQYSLYCV